MSIFKKPANDDELNKSNERVRVQLRDDRSFWDLVVTYADAENETEAARVVKVADLLLAARKERFPL